MKQAASRCFINALLASITKQETSMKQAENKAFCLAWVTLQP
jgi:hypothetical protein